MVSLRKMFSPQGLLEEQIKGYIEKNQKDDKKIKPMKNPFFEEVPILKHKKPTGKFETVKRNPKFEHINEHDRKLLKKFRKFAWTFDNGLGVKRFRVGWCTIIGLFIPVGGDIIDVLLMCMLIHYAGQVSGGKSAKDVQKMRQKMIGNLMVALGIGLIPGAGAIFDNFFRCNTRNAGLLEALLEERELKKAIRPQEEDTYDNRGNTPPNLPHRRRGTEKNIPIELRNVLPRQRDGKAEHHVEKANSSESRRGDFFRRPYKTANGKIMTQVTRVEEPTRKQEPLRPLGKNPRTPEGFF